MKKMKKIAAISLAAAMTMAMAGCGNSVPKNTVNSVDDLEGKRSVSSSEPQVIFMHLITKAMTRVPRSSVTTREPMRFRR